MPFPDVGHNIDVPATEEPYTIHKLLQDLARQEFASTVQLQAVADSLNDYRPRNVIGYDQYVHHFHSFPEETLVSGVEKLYSGKGASKDHPKLHQLFMDSFQHHPQLLALYNAGEFEDEKAEEKTGEVEDEKRDDVIDAYQKEMHEKKYGPARYKRKTGKKTTTRKKHAPGSLKHRAAAPTMRWLKWKYPEYVDDVVRYSKRKDRLSAADLADLKWMKEKYPERYDMVMRFMKS